MTPTRLRWYHRLRISNAYGQLIALIFLPIMVLSCVGAALVLTETARSSRAEQSNAAFAILSRYQPIAQRLTPLLGVGSSQESSIENNQEKVRSILQNMLNESHLLRVAVIDSEGRPRIAFGYGNNLPWPQFAITREAFGPLESDIGTVYGIRAGFTVDGPVWLVVDMDNQPMQLARYRVWLVLAITGLLTLLLLLLCLNFYSRRWIAPMYEVRLQLQRMNAENLGREFAVTGSGELLLLQQDIGALLYRLADSFKELEAHTEQTEDDLRKTLDALEIQNITYRKARDHAVSANQAKSVFLANISHELRTPLNSIDGFINLMARKGRLTDEQNVYVQTIRKSSAHLLALVNDVLDFSKIDAGKLVLEQAPFDLEEAIYDVMDMLSPLACEKKLDMAVYYYADMPKLVNGDALRLKQILTNLVSNAIKFTPDGEIIVRARLENTQNNQHLIHVSIQDSGIGLSGTDRKQLFESFSQGDPSVTRQFGGTGLGLAISRQLVQLMQGRIGFEDNQERHPTDKGSTFWFTIKMGVVAHGEAKWPTLRGWNVLSSIQHSASANVLRGYLLQLEVEQEEAQSLPDLFGRLALFDATRDQHSWVIVDSGGDTEALLKEIRTRYQGSLAVYTYQAAIDPQVLSRYNAVALHQPMSRAALIALLQNEPEEIEQQPDFNGQNLHILAVDDHLPNLMVLDALLSDLGVKVTTATSGHEALGLITTRHDLGQPAFDLIFMDIQMPRMSGLEVTQAIRKHEEEWNIAPTPVIALTAHALSDERDHLLSTGMNDYVSKPIQIEQLIHILSTWTKREENVTQRPSEGFYAQEFNDFEQSQQQYRPNGDVLDWNESLYLSAGKEDLALDLLHILVNGFEEEKAQLWQLVNAQDYVELEQLIHRMNGATRYLGVPSLQEICMQYEQFLSSHRKQNKLHDNEFTQQVTILTSQLIEAMEDVAREAAPLLT